MLALLERKNGAVIKISNFDSKFATSESMIYMSGRITGIINEDYTIGSYISLIDVFERLLQLLCKLCGEYTLISIHDGLFDLLQVILVV